MSWRWVHDGMNVLMTLNGALKMVKVVNAVLCLLYHN